MASIRAKEALTLTVACWASIATGQVIVEVQPSSSNFFSPATLGTQYTLGPDNSVELIDGSVFAYQVSVTDPTTQDLGAITYNQTDDLVLLVSSNALGVSSTSPLDDGARNWAGLVGSGTNRITLQASLTGSTTGPITARRILRLDIDGDVGLDSTDIITVDPASGAFLVDVIESATGDINADIKVNAGDIGTIHAPLGAILGDIRAEDGTIDRIFSANGIGTSVAPVEIFAGADVSGETDSDRVTIAFIGSQEDIYADITASDGAAKEGRFGRMIANTGGALDGSITGSGIVGKKYTGSFVTYDADGREGRDGATGNFPTINLAMLDGTLRFHDVPFTLLAIGEVTSSSLILFEKGLNPPADTDPDAQILEFTGSLSTTFPAQMIVNADGSLDTDGSALFDWNAEVMFSNDTLADKSDDILILPSEAPFYEELPSDFGGGAIGLAPFNFHDKAGLVVDPGVSESQFEAGDTLIVQAGDDEQIVIEHYGPVFATGTPLEIHKLVSGPLGNDSSWEDTTTIPPTPLDDVTSEWTQTVSSTATLGERTVTLEPAVDWEAGWYRAKPAGTTGGLKCSFVTGNPDAAYDSGRTDALEDYFYFRIRVLSFLDLSQNFAVDAPDASMWLNEPVDFNDDGAADGTDFQMILDNMD
jgi:hypothetical protein